MRLEVELKNALNPHAPTQEPKVVVWAHNSHIGDVRATETHAAIGQRANTTELAAAVVRGAAQISPKWSLGHLCRETFGRESVFSCGFSMHGGTVTASPKWGEPAHCLALHPALPNSVGETMHRTLPLVREIHNAPQANALLCLFSDRGVGTDAKPPPKEAESVWSRGDPLAAAAAKAAEAAEEAELMPTLGGEALRTTRVRMLRRALYATLQMRFVGGTRMPEPAPHVMLHA